jgi:acyl transferase domain-containing protein
VAIDTACSSSLVAIHNACQALLQNEVTMALAGGVFIHCTPKFYKDFHQAGMLSPTGRCHTFDDRADGFVPGEGVGVVVLKRFDQAVEDGDNIIGVVCGSATNQDGRTNGITAPSGKSQQSLYQQVYQKFAINPREIQMVEAHGTGTKLGDPIEYQSLSKAFREYTSENQYCAIGSIKTNIGHTTAAAGIAGLFKSLLSLQHRQIPPSLHYQNGNSNISFDDSPFYVNTSLQQWDYSVNCTRKAAVNSFGFSGTNAHIVVEEAPNIPKTQVTKPAYLVMLSAKSSLALSWQAKRLMAYCQKYPNIDMASVSYTLMTGRKYFSHRLTCIVKDCQDLLEQLMRWLENHAYSNVRISFTEKSNENSGKNLQLSSNNTDQQYLENLQLAADLFHQGEKFDCSKIFGEQVPHKVSLPSYPFQKKSYWIERQAIKKDDVQDPLDKLYQQVIDLLSKGKITPTTAEQMLKGISANEKD